MCKFVLIHKCRWIVGSLLCAAALLFGSQSPAQELGPAPISTYPPPLDIRNGGALAESYSYHRQVVPAASPWPRITPQNGWYHYGFPVSSYRWGWFGAERYYPLNFSHRGYNGDYCRVGYRYGF